MKSTKFFIQVEGDWIPMYTKTGIDIERLPGTHLLVGKEGVHVININ